MRILTLALLFLIFLTSPVTAQDDPPPPGQNPEQQLTTIQRDITWLEQEIVIRKKDLASAGKDETADIAEDLADLESRLQKARFSFIATAASVDLPSPDVNKGKPKKRDLMQEAQSFIEPLFDAIRRVSEKPRRIESYRTRIFDIGEQLTALDKALVNLDRVIQLKTYPAFAAQLQDSRQTLSHNRDELQVQLDNFQRKLAQEMQDHRTVMQVVTEEISDFFSTKGKNLLISAIVFAVVFWGLLYLKTFVFRSSFIRRKLHLGKSLQAIYAVFAGFGAILAVLFTLHFLNDWFLVTVITLVLFGVLWTLKAFMPVFINEMKLVLNLGSVKAGERVVWQGVPWLVKSLGFRSVLVNEALQGGQITLPASALASMLSRTTVEGEPWFPSRVGDFVALDDGSFGQVETQTPENVIINTGSTRKHYATTAYLSRNPQNFSQGFEVTAEFLIRRTPAQAPSETALSKLPVAISAKLGARLNKPEPDFRNFSTVIGASGPASTRVWLRAECPGRLAGQRDELKRELQTAAGEAWRELAPNA